MLGCKKDKDPTPTPAGAAPAEIQISSAPVIVGAGDIAVCGTSGDEETGGLVDSVVRADSAANITTAVFTLGDNAYPSGDGGVDKDFQRCFSGSWGRPRIMSIIHPSPGNHDYDSGSATPYFSYFGSRAGDSGKGYYSYDVGSWHLISLNSELYFEVPDPAEAKRQEDWLRKDLADHRTLCTLAYFHRPLFSSGTYGPTREVRTLWDILYNAGADVILNGHEHHYERFLPQSPMGAADSARGIEQIIAGTGGGELRKLRHPLAANSVVQIHGHFGILKLELGNGQYSHAFIDSSGRVWDPGGRKCH